MKSSILHALGVIFVLTLSLEAAQTYVIHDVTVIPMNSERVLTHQTVVVENDVISEIAPANSVKIPSKARHISGGGMYLIPGLTDTHAHIYSPIELPLYLANGVTTVFNLNGRPAHLLWRKWINEGKLIGPAIFSAGPAFMSRHSADEAMRIVDDQAATGYDAIKIYNQVSKEEYASLIAEAKKKNLLLIGHVAREPGFEATIQAGQSIAHAEEFTYTYFNPKHDDNFSSIVFDEAKIPIVSQMTASSGVYVIPTISTFRDILQQATDLDHYLRNPNMKYLAPWLLESLQPETNQYQNRYSPEDLRQLQLSLTFQRKLIYGLEAAGVPLMTGTDSTSNGPVAGFSIHDELSELVKSGLTPFQALQASTIIPAKYLRRSSEYGTIEKGKRADLVMLSANPLTQIENTRQIAGVLSHGQWLDFKALKRISDKTPQAYKDEEKFLEHQFKSNPLEAGKYLDEHDPSGQIGAEVLARIAIGSSPNQFHQILEQIRRKLPESEIAGEDVINWIGRKLLRENLSGQAIQVFIINIEDFPKSANALNSLAEAYAKTGSTEKAVEYYEKALQLDRDYPNAQLAHKFIEEHTGKNQP